MCSLAHAAAYFLQAGAPVPVPVPVTVPVAVPVSTQVCCDASVPPQHCVLMCRGIPRRDYAVFANKGLGNPANVRAPSDVQYTAQVSAEDGAGPKQLRSQPLVSCNSQMESSSSTQ